MSSPKKQLLNKINRLHTKIQYEQQQLKQHKDYFHIWTTKHSLIVLSLLLPAFLLGWQKGKTIRGKKRLKSLLKFLFLTTIKNLRKLT